MTVDFTNSQVFFHSSDPLSSPWPYSVPVGGRTIVSHKDGMVRRRYHEQVLILTLSGEGRIELGEGVFPARAESIVWLDTALKYAHGARPGGSWAYLWFAMAGHGLDRLYEETALPDHPVIEDMGHLSPRFESVLLTLAEQPPTADAVLNMQVAAITAALFSERCAAWTAAGSDPIRKLMQHLRRTADQNWEIDAMADIAGLSPSQLFRRFKAATGTSPVAWLRLERMQLARHLLTGTSERIASIANRCGYSDPFHFSRDFKRHHACSPRDFRASSS